MMRVPRAARALQRMIPILAGKITLQELHILLAICKAVDQDGDEGCQGEPYYPGIKDEVLFEDISSWVNAVRPYLPIRSHRKVADTKLIRFVWAHQNWFTLSDFAKHFNLHHKTAWEYLSTWQAAGLVIHNGGKTARARYRIELARGPND